MKKAEAAPAPLGANAVPPFSQAVTRLS